jgi:hypothetical protein
LPEADEIATEIIPSEDEVARHLFEPSMRKPDLTLQWQNIFMFKTDRQPPNCESVVWTKYAAWSDGVHELGCEKQRHDRAEGRAAQTYIGAMKAGVGAIRALRTAGGARFDVVHDPTGGQGVHHAHITMVDAAKKNDRTELKAKLQAAFSPLHGHACNEAAA